MYDLYFIFFYILEKDLIKCNPVKMEDSQMAVEIGKYDLFLLRVDFFHKRTIRTVTDDTAPFKLLFQSASMIIVCN